MNAFKNWLHKYTHGELVSQRYELADAWRAALAEVLKQLDTIYGGDFENSDIVKWIEEECQMKGVRDE